MTQDAGQPTPVFTLHDIASQLEENIAQFEPSNDHRQEISWMGCMESSTSTTPAR